MDRADIRGHGTLMPYADLFGRARKRSRSKWHTSVDSEAVVGISDSRRRSTRAKQCKADGPAWFLSDVDRFADPEVSRLYDGITVDLFCQPTCLLVGKVATTPCFSKVSSTGSKTF